MFCTAENFSFTDPHTQGIAIAEILLKCRPTASGIRRTFRIVRRSSRSVRIQIQIQFHIHHPNHQLLVRFEKIELYEIVTHELNIVMLTQNFILLNKKISGRKMSVFIKKQKNRSRL